MGVKFIDLDDYIVEKAGKSISQIFSSQGEDYFRKLEADAIREVCNVKNIVVATGGGAACFHDNMTIMNVAGVTIYLDVPVEEVTKRLWNQPMREQRPMVGGKTKEELLRFMNELLNKRVEFYQEAKLIVKGNNITAGQILEELESWD